jgi:hypothetical protein
MEGDPEMRPKFFIKKLLKPSVPEAERVLLSFAAASNSKRDNCPEIPPHG